MTYVDACDVMMLSLLWENETAQLRNEAALGELMSETGSERPGAGFELSRLDRPTSRLELEVLNAG